MGIQAGSDTYRKFFQRLSKSCSRDPIGNLPASHAIAVLQHSIGKAYP